MSVGGRVRITRKLRNGVGGDVERQIGKHPVFGARRDARQKVGAAYLDVRELGRSIRKRPDQPIVDLVSNKHAAAPRQQSRDMPAPRTDLDYEIVRSKRAEIEKLREEALPGEEVLGASRPPTGHGRPQP